MTTAAAAPPADRANRLTIMNAEAMHAGFDTGFRTACDLFSRRITEIIPNPPHVGRDPREWLAMMTRILQITAQVRRAGAASAPQSPPQAGKIPDSDPPLVRTGQGDYTYDVSPEDLRP
ncbi:MAG: hypothetical protein IMZ44_24770 [Planctomycetes bacterium]|nr:hypothetical protein [Planctomycetota bacterium]